MLVNVPYMEQLGLGAANHKSGNLSSKVFSFLLHRASRSPTFSCNSVTKDGMTKRCKRLLRYSLYYVHFFQVELSWKRRDTSINIFILYYIYRTYIIYLFIYSFIYLVTRLIETTCLPWCIVRIAPKPPDKGHTKPAECCEIRTKSGEANWDMRVFFFILCHLCVRMYVSNGPVCCSIERRKSMKIRQKQL